MMYGELYQYFVLHKHLNVPGVGTFLLERRPAIADFPNKQLLPPSFVISWQKTSINPTRHFFNWLAAALKIADRDAIIRFNDFAFDMKKQLLAGSTIEWKGIGTLTRGLGDEIKFEAEPVVLHNDQPVTAHKVIREKAEHTVRVGEDQKTSTEMRDYFSHAEERKNFWWAWALAVGIIAIVFIGWYFSEHGLSTTSTANGKPMTPATVTTTYQQLN